MKKVLIISDDTDIIPALDDILKKEFRVFRSESEFAVGDTPDLIIFAASTQFSSFCSIRKQIHDVFTKIPAIFLWVEEDCFHVLTCDELQFVNGKIIPRNDNSLLECISDSFFRVSDSISNDTDGEQRLSEIQSDIRKTYEDAYTDGALQVEYDSFASIYRFVEQLAERSGQRVQTLLLTLVPRRGMKPEPEQLHCAMEQLSQAIHMTLRKNDVLTGCSHSQMLVLLMDADDDGGHLATQRILNTFLGLYDEDIYELHYDIRPIGVKP